MNNEKVTDFEIGPVGLSLWRDDGDDFLDIGRNFGLGLFGRRSCRARGRRGSDNSILDDWLDGIGRYRRRRVTPLVRLGHFENGVQRI